jgi:hypothetical protein
VATENELVNKLRGSLRLPSDTPAEKVIAAFEVDAMRRAAAVGLSWAAKFSEIEKAEAVVAASRRVAAAQMVGHTVKPRPEDPYVGHPALRPVTGRGQGNFSTAIDWAAIVAEGDGE